MNIVIADDNLVALKLLKKALTESGHEVCAVADGRRALDALKDGTRRLVIADWRMPVMDGLELCRALRTEGLPGYVYFILLTGHGGTNNKVEALSAGVDDFITKPFDRAELAAKVRGAERLLALETRELTIFALAKLAESHDPETGSHLDRVRIYKPAFDHLVASAIIREGSGLHFDPHLVDIFHTLERQFSETRAAFGDSLAQAA